MFSNLHFKKKPLTSPRITPPSTEKTNLEKMREDAIQQFNEIKIPKCFIDPLLFKPFIDPVVTPSGRIYSSMSIKRHLLSDAADPFSNEPLRAEDLRPLPEEIMHIYTALNDAQTSTQGKILVAENSDDANRWVNRFRLRLVQLESEMENACKQHVIKSSIQIIKDNLKLDSNNNEHKDFWKSKCRFEKKIPTHVNNMMFAANNESFETVEDFLQAINAERRSSCCGKFFKWGIRNSTTRALYSQKDEDLKTFVVR